MNTKAIGIRLSIESIEAANKRAARRKWSFNKWINWAVRNGLRNHNKPSTDIMSGEKVK